MLEKGKCSDGEKQVSALQSAELVQIFVVAVVFVHLKRSGNHGYQLRMKFHSSYQNITLFVSVLGHEVSFLCDR